MKRDSLPEAQAELLDRVRHEDFDRFEEALNQSTLLPLVGLSVMPLDLMKSVSSVNWVSSPSDLVVALLACPDFLTMGFTCSAENLRFLNTLREAIFQNTNAPTNFLFHRIMVYRHWQSLAKLPMLPLWLEVGNPDVLNALTDYYAVVENNLIDGLYPRENYFHPILFDLVEDFPQFDRAWISLLREFVHEAFPSAAEMPVLSGDSSQDILQFKNDLSLFDDLEHLSRDDVRGYKTAEPVYSMILRIDTETQHISKKPPLPISTVRYFCFDAYQNLISFRDGISQKKLTILQGTMTYLRFLHKVSDLTGVPMPYHLLSEVFHG